MGNPILNVYWEILKEVLKMEKRILCDLEIYKEGSKYSFGFNINTDGDEVVSDTSHVVALMQYLANGVLTVDFPNLISEGHLHQSSEDNEQR